MSISDDRPFEAMATRIGQSLAAKLFDSRSRKGADRPERNVEVHLREVELAAIIAAGAEMAARIATKD